MGKDRYLPAGKKFGTWWFICKIYYLAYFLNLYTNNDIVVTMLLWNIKGYKIADLLTCPWKLKWVKLEQEIIKCIKYNNKEILSEE